MPTLWLPLLGCDTASPFDPDWASGAVDVPTITPATTVVLNLGDPGGPDLPAGRPADTIVVFMVTDYNGAATPVLTDAEFYDGEADPAGSLDIVSQLTGPLNECIITLRGPRPANWDGGGINLTFSPGAGDYVYAVGNFPCTVLPEIGFEEEYPWNAPPVTTDTISAPGTGIFAGMMVTDYDSGPGDGPYSVTPTGAGNYDDEYVATVTTDYDIIVWAYQTTSADAEFDLVGNFIHYAIILGDEAA